MTNSQSITFVMAYLTMAYHHLFQYFTCDIFEDDLPQPQKPSDELLPVSPLLQKTQEQLCVLVLCYEFFPRFGKSEKMTVLLWNSLVFVEEVVEEEEIEVFDWIEANILL